MPFRAMLNGFAARHKSVVRGVIFCDEEGERVEGLVCDPALDPFDLDIAGASYATLIPLMAEQGTSSLVRITFVDGVTWLQLLQDGYYVLVLTTKHYGTENEIALTIGDLAEGIIEHM